MKVERRKNESFDSLMKRFQQAVHNSNILKEWKERSTYEKPSITKRKARKARLKFIREAQRERLQMLDKE